MEIKSMPVKPAVQPTPILYLYPKTGSTSGSNRQEWLKLLFAFLSKVAIKIKLFKHFSLK
jgi:hypothetical protein